MLGFFNKPKKSKPQEVIDRRERPDRRKNCVGYNGPERRRGDRRRDNSA